jgi:large subunit ribosomal protein L17
MRHRIHHRKLNRTSEHRWALRRNLAQSLVEHGQVSTTLAKARDLQPFFEKLVTLAVRAKQRAAKADDAGALRARRGIERLMGDRAVIPADHRQAYADSSDSARSRALRMASGRRYRTGEPRGRLAFTAESVVRRLIEKVGAQYLDRPGGYTRLIRLAKRRLGDAASVAIVQLVGNETAPMSLTKPAKSARRRRADRRYAAAISATKSWSSASKKKEPAPAEASDRAAEVPASDSDEGES